MGENEQFETRHLITRNTFPIMFSIQKFDVLFLTQLILDDYITQFLNRTS